MKIMDGLTAKEIAKILGISYDNVRKRIEKARIKPITKDAIYPHDTVEKICDVAPVGRPPKAKQPEPAKPTSKKADMSNMEGLTVDEMAEILRIKPTTVRQRLMVAGIRPKTKSPLYEASALEAIRSVPGKGRPKKADKTEK